MVKRGNSLKDYADKYVLKPYGRREETHKKKFAWICEGCGKSYLYRASAQECERGHDKEAHPEKYIDERTVFGHALGILRSKIDEFRYRKKHEGKDFSLLQHRQYLSKYKAKREHSREKLQELIDIIGEERFKEIVERSDLAIWENKMAVEEGLNWMSDELIGDWDY